MAKQGNSDGREPTQQRHSVSVLIRLVVEPTGSETDRRVRVDALELNDAQRRNFSSIPSALEWVGEVLESRADGWRPDHDTADGRYQRGSRSQ